MISEYTRRQPGYSRIPCCHGIRIYYKKNTRYHGVARWGDYLYDIFIPLNLRYVGFLGFNWIPAAGGIAIDCSLLLLYYSRFRIYVSLVWG